MRIELPDREIASLELTPEQARLELAVGLYAGGRVSISRGARIAGVAYAFFWHELGRRNLPIKPAAEDAEPEMRMAEELSHRTARA